MDKDGVETAAQLEREGLAILEVDGAGGIRKFQAHINAQNKMYEFFANDGKELFEFLDHERRYKMHLYKQNL